MVVVEVVQSASSTRTKSVQSGLLNHASPIGNLFTPLRAVSGRINLNQVSTPPNVLLPLSADPNALWNGEAEVRSPNGPTMVASQTYGCNSGKNLVRNHLESQLEAHASLFLVLDVPR